MLRFELKKVKREKSFYFFLCLLMIAALSPIFLTDTYQDRFKAVQIESLLNQNKSSIQRLTDVPEAKRTVKNMKEENLYYEKILKAINEIDAATLLQTEYKLKTMELQQIRTGSLQGVPLVEQEKSVMVLEHLITQGIAQVDHFKHRMPGWNYLYLIFSDEITYTYLFLFAGILVALILTLEKRRQTNPFYNVLPLTAWKKGGLKLLTTCVCLLFGIGLALGAAFVIFTILEGTGTLHYPIGIIDPSKHAAIIPLYSYLLRVGLLFGCWLLFLCCLSFLVSLFTGNMAVNVSILMLLVMASEFKVAKSKYLITSHLNFPNIVAGGSGYTEILGDEITISFSAMLIVLYSVALLLVSYFVIKRKGDLL